MPMHPHTLRLQHAVRLADQATLLLSALTDRPDRPGDDRPARAVHLLALALHKALDALPVDGPAAANLKSACADLIEASPVADR